MNIGFATMLYDTVNKVYRYYYISTNHLLFDRAFTVSTNQDMTTFSNKIVSLDIGNNYYLKRPNSGWIVASLPNVEVSVYRLKGVPIGAGVELTEYVKKSRSIICFTRDEAHGHDYDDNLCLFRCLALHFGASPHSHEREANRHKEKLEQETGKSFDKGLELGMLAIVEIYFNIAINVYCLQETGHATILRLSKITDPDLMHLHLYEQHFSYISKFKSFAKKYTCTICGRVLNQSCHVKRHAKVCNDETEEIYVGGNYRTLKTSLNYSKTLT